MSGTDTLRPATLVLGGVVALAAAIGIGRFVYTPILPIMVEQLGLTQSQAGLIASANYLGYLLGALAASIRGLPGRRRTWLLVALAVSAVTTGAMALPSEMVPFLAMRFVGGFASAFVLVFVSAIILDGLARVRRPQISTLHFAGVGVGIALSAMLVSSMATQGYDWRAFWLASGVISLAGALLVARWVPGGLALEGGGHDGSHAKMGRHLMTLIAAYGLFGFGYVITATFLVAIVRSTPEVKALEPVVWLVVGLAGAPSIVVWMWVGGKIGFSRAFALACLVEAVGVGLSVYSSTASGIILSAVFLGGTFMGITAIGLIEARRLSGGDPRPVLALMTASFGLGQIIGPIFAGVTFDRTGSFAVPSMAAALALTIAAAMTVRPPVAGHGDEPKGSDANS